MRTDVTILLLADSHLGLDLPTNPRVARRRRGHDFLANHEAALAPALAGAVDVVVHGGDVFDRPRVPVSLGWQALAPLVRVAERGVPVFIVPGNHERSRLPHAHLAVHPHVYVFDRARTFVVEVGGVRIALAGFPFERGEVRSRFPGLLEESGWARERADVRLLCMHHCFEGATVGPGDFTFRNARDVVRAADVPAGFAAVLSGHIHRHQVLTTDLRGSPLPAPVLYPGSVERTSLAEIGEAKGYLLVRLKVSATQPSRGRGPARPLGRPSPRPACSANVEAASPSGDSALETRNARSGSALVGTGSAGDVCWEFRPLAARPMLIEEIGVDGLSPGALESAVRATVEAAPPDAVLRIRLTGGVGESQLHRLRAARLRTFVPDTMNLDIRLAGGALPFRRPAAGGAARKHDRADRPAPAAQQLELAPAAPD